MDNHPDNLILAKARQMAIQAHLGETTATGEPLSSRACAIRNFLNGMFSQQGMKQAPVAMQAAALLHAAVARNAATYDQIAIQFGENVAELVYWNTPVAHELATGETAAHLNHRRIQQASRAAQILKTCEIACVTAELALSAEGAERFLEQSMPILKTIGTITPDDLYRCVTRYGLDRMHGQAPGLAHKQDHHMEAEQ